MFLNIILLLLAIPVGLLIAYLTSEELKDGQKYFKALIILSIIVGIWFFLTGQTYVTWTAAFIAISTFISILKIK
ncbi:MAG: hypothetical protein ABIG28_01375 [archaeon]